MGVSSDKGGFLLFITLMAQFLNLLGRVLILKMVIKMR